MPTKPDGIDQEPVLKAPQPHIGRTPSAHHPRNIVDSCVVFFIVLSQLLSDLGYPDLGSISVPGA